MSPGPRMVNELHKDLSLRVGAGRIRDKAFWWQVWTEEGWLCWFSERRTQILGQLYCLKLN